MPSGKIQRVVLFLPNWVGDAIQATPLLSQLRALLGSDVRLIGLGKQTVRTVLAGHPTGIEMIAKPLGAGRIFKTWRLLGRLKPDAVVLLTNDFPSAFASWLAHVPLRAGYARRGRGPFLSHKLQAARRKGRLTPVPAVDYYLALAAVFGAARDKPPLSLSVDPAAQALVTQKLATFPDQSRPLIVLNNSGAFGPAKKLPRDRIEELARALLDKGARVLLLAGPDEAKEARALAAAIASPHLLAAPDLAAPSLAISKALIAKARLLISSDSGPRHMGPALGVPTVSVFGPTDPRWTDLQTPLDAPAHLTLDCQPCQKRDCPLGHHSCLKDLPLSLILAAVDRQLTLQWKSF